MPYGKMNIVTLSESNSLFKQFEASSSLKRMRTESPLGYDDVSNQNPAAHVTVDRKRRRHAVTEILLRQQLLSGLICAQATGPTHSDYALSKHVETCNSGSCAFEECSLAKKCLAHFKKCDKESCIVCVEARLHQVIDQSGPCSEEKKFQFSAWRARLQSVNDETKEYVPYFNSCAKELLVARSTRSPFIQAAKERLQSAQALVSQSEKRYAELCSEIHGHWHQVVRSNDDCGSTDAASCEENLHDKTPNCSPANVPHQSKNAWHDPSHDTLLRLQIIQKIFEWSKATNPNAILLGDRVMLDGASKAEVLLYSMSSSRKEYEEEAERMCEGR